MSFKLDAKTVDLPEEDDLMMVTMIITVTVIIGLTFRQGQAHLGSLSQGRAQVPNLQVPRLRAASKT